MDGIEILTMEQIKECPQWVEYIVAIFVILFFVAILFMVICAFISADVGFVGGVVTSIALVIILLILFIIGECYKKPTGRYRYEALIDKSVPIEQVYEKYDVVERRGKIWVLEDKE